MALHSGLPEFEQFDLNSELTSLGIKWKRWSTRLENLFVALNVKNEARQKALLLHYGGKEFSCGECSKTFSQNVHLKTHLESVHLRITKFKCSACEMQFYDRSKL